MGRFELDLFKLQLIYHRLLSRSLVIKILLVSAAVAMFPILVSLREIDPTFDDCDGTPVTSGISLPAAILDAVVLDLMARKWLWRGDRALCLGRGSGPAAAATAMKRMGVLPAVGAMEGCGRLPFPRAAFDFVFFAALDRAVAPARIVLEMERVLRPGRAGAVAVGPTRRGGGGRAAAPVAALLRASEVVAVRAVNGTWPVAVVVVVFKKRERSRRPM
ncbi:Ubiquinone/menaquinone biosynthesis methyltransferase ubiE [Cocos nucifera]|uniref:Ubiquinone/menaquinone biosynthesis methyltransferase ubiE n=1 Tax=Cocos nucifera TaxID=13894 RepID=A0A8K0IR20_COCNU|nr:Ubiquinone/menaquinone biosynthesis methyltransferase ubiE [Cocos nucifera]